MRELGFLNDLIISELGKEIRKVRQEKDLRMNEVALKAKISKGLLSKIENGRTIPSLPVLISIIKSLEVNLSEFFGKVEQNNLQYNLIHRKPDEFKPFEKEEAIGFLYRFILSHSFSRIAMEAVLLELKPGSRRELVTTDALEFKYMLEGEVEYEIGERTILFKKGEALLFDGRTPHVPVNRSQKAAKMLVMYLFWPVQE